MFNTQSSSFLRRVLLADALTSFGTGLLLTLDAGFLAPLLGLPSALLREAGLILLPFAALVAYVGTREQVSPRWVWAVILGNALWVVDSIALLLSGWVTPNLAGTAFVAAQALAVAVLAELEYVGLRKNTALAV
ncbi:hypothetical protein [Herbaspirillum sp. ST 5-3]|uniref:hypothetical protein n=1 Tax=Oxalobacteraceae TaxID=75682 RepID=UPI0010A546ED|nr:hypothetical protein [Herbaspirillum sp. ST 5-3]